MMYDNIVYIYLLIIEFISTINHTIRSKVTRLFKIFSFDEAHRKAHRFFLMNSFSNSNKLFANVVGGFR